METDSYIFSIVMATYNTEEYVEEAINSIINQTFEFDKIQFIIMDDGSTDNTGEICKKYSEKYDNIIYHYQENTGQSIARNNGLKLVKGQYVNFLDSDDKLELNAFEEVYKFIQQHGEEVDVIAIPRWKFGASEGPLPSHYRFDKTRVIDINKEFDCPQFSIPATFIRTSALTDRFEPKLVISEDALLVNKTILHKMKYGVVNSTRYLYRKRFEETSTVDTKKRTKEYYIPYLENYFIELINHSIDKFGYVHRYIQYTLMFDFQWVLNIRDLNILNEQEFQEYHSLLHEILQFIDDDIILSQKYLNNCYKCFVLKLKYDSNNFKIIASSNNLSLDLNGKVIDNINFRKITLNKINLLNNTLYISGFFESSFEDVSIHVTNNDKTLTVKKISGEDIYALGKKVCPRQHFEVEINLQENNEIKFYIKYENHLFEKNLSIGSKLNENFSKKLRLNSYVANYSNNKIIIKYSKELQLLKTDLVNLLDEQELINRDIIEKTKKWNLFNETYYLNQFDSYDNTLDPFFHYVFRGYLEGKNPSKKFNTNYYQNSITPSEQSHLNPLIYFINYGFERNEIQINPSVPLLKHVNKIELNDKINNINESGLRLKKRNEKIIVSLTSFPDRMHDIHYSLYSLLKQTFKPDEIILWLSYEQFPNKEKDIPNKVLNLKKYGLSIRWCDNIYSYKKLIPSLKEYENDFIVTADDDIFYPKDWLRNIYYGYKKHPNCIISSRSRRILVNNNGTLKSYNNWKLIDNDMEPSFLNFPTNGAGSLFPPNSFDETILKKREFSNICPTGDDIWIWGMAVLNNTKIYPIPQQLKELTYINPARDLNLFNEKTLYSENKHKNDSQINKLIEKYPLIMERILNENKI
ncbi:glycosyltransferase family 2 protein [uncultured Methanobrevibacter sp.]|uniref:glycosyltransferase family 2 protein n=1 Tax=uncultured Methanobrevibacter sp. TaxID=253161 RepID=UPI00260A33D8|nr:glycosyltransferase [uncultured Methanobrevibacter sp.]